MTRQTSNKGKGGGRKFLVYAGMAAIFLACLWLIFAPSGGDDAAGQGSGFNAEIPDPRGAGIVGDKMTAYEQEQQRLRQSERMNTLDDYSALLEQPRDSPEERAARQERELRMAPKPAEYYEHPEWWGENGSPSGGGAIRSSASAHAELTGTLGNFFEEPQADPEKEEMAAEIERLNARLAERQTEQTTIDDLMERSYQLAAKYAGAGTSAPSADGSAAPPTGRSARAAVEPVTRVRQSVVSSLAAPLSEAELTAQYPQERNRGFNTVGAGESAAAKNTIAAAVYGDQTVTDGQAVRLRTTEPMRAGGILIPRNTVITGTGSLSGERLEIAVTAVEYGGTIVPVKLAVHDSDGQAGIHVPGSMEIEALKEIAGEMGSSPGSTVNLNRQSAGGQLLTDLGRGVIQGVSRYASKKAGQVRVRLKAGYRILLLPEANP
jgi:conjugative transposon TraM protein